MVVLPTNKMEEHVQIGGCTCIPSGVEFILKQLGLEDIAFYELQNRWSGDSFGAFDGFEYKGLRFACKFDQGRFPRGPSFPFDQLFRAISEELRAGRYVLISLANGTGGWHIFVVYGEESGEFLAKSKDGDRTIEVNDVKRYVHVMGGTDILTYTAPATPPY